ncbi:MAG: hypothetical protein IJW29_05180 [Clostridia bacterium]|nr:hypothetical protein [Clostridia bacterium]
MKKLLSLILALCLAMSAVLMLSACDKKEEDTKKKDGGDNVQYVSGRIGNYTYTVPEDMTKVTETDSRVTFTKHVDANVTTYTISTQFRVQTERPEENNFAESAESLLEDARQGLNAAYGGGVKSAEVISKSDNHYAFRFEIEHHDVKTYMYNYTSYAVSEVSDGFACNAVIVQFHVTGTDNQDLFAKLIGSLRLSPQ